MESAFNIYSAHLGRQGDDDCKARTGRGGALELLEVFLYSPLESWLLVEYLKGNAFPALILSCILCANFRSVLNF